MATFWKPINRGSLGQFWVRFFRVFSRALLQSFLASFRASFPYQKESLSRGFSCVFKRISCAFYHSFYLVFLTQAWAFHCYIHPLRFLLWECLLVIQRRDHKVFHLLYLRSCKELQRLRPRRASKYACIVPAGTSEGLAGSKVLEEAHCRCCGIEWSCGINYSRNLS